MATELSNLHSELIINGTRVTGLSDDNPVQLPVMALIEEKVGQDGTLYARTTGQRGGEVKVKLLPSSETAKRWFGKVAEIQGGARVEWEGSYGDPSLNYSVLMRGGVLKEAPPGATPDTDPEFTFYFEELVPQYDGSKFGSAPVNSGGNFLVF